jgi:NDP-4-keto-2,6-dideoxyhexose 3-C-methyltransferase
MREISACRICDNPELVQVLDLGRPFLNSVLPRSRNDEVPAAPLKLMKCVGDADVCGLLQLAHWRPAHALPHRTDAWSFEAHTSAAERRCSCNRTILRRLMLPEETSADDTLLHREAEYSDSRKVIISPFSVLSAQDQPLQFLRAVRSMLDERAVWILQERYMPLMLQRNAYDSICHEYAAYYALRQIRWLAHRSGLKVVDVEFDDIGAGTASIALASAESAYPAAPIIDVTLDEEARNGLHTLHPYRTFARRVTAGIALLRTFLDRARDAGESVCALGATTEGNSILQCCRATQQDISQVGETDAGKVGAFTPGTLLPIALEEEVLDRRPDFLLVLPWQLRALFLRQPQLRGCNLLFSLPNLEVVRSA